MSDYTELRKEIRQQQSVVLNIVREHGLISEAFQEALLAGLRKVDSAHGYVVQRIGRLAVAMPKVAMLNAGIPYTQERLGIYNALRRSIPKEKMADLIEKALAITDDEIDVEPVPNLSGWSLHVICYATGKRWEDKAFPQLQEMVGKEIPEVLVNAAISSSGAGKTL